LIINDDTEFGPDFLANAAAAVRPNSLLLARAYRLATGEFSEVGVYWDWRKLICTPVKDGGEVNCFSTRGLFLTFGDFVRIGGFHTRMLPHYLSDYEFTLRAHRKGFALISDERVVLHYDEALTGLRDIEDRSMWQRMLADFSIRSAGNPVYWTSFVLLASPLRYVPLNIVRVWAGFFTPVRVRIRATLIVPGRIFLGKVKRKTIKLWTTGQW